MSTRRGCILPYDTKSRYIPSLANADQLGSLHESVLSHIMSKLPAKDAVRTCILSKDWKYKWTCIYHVEIADYRFLANKGGLANFVKFVEGILEFTHQLTSFSLKCFLMHDASRLTRWIYDIFRHENIRSMEIILLTSPGNKQPIVLPWSLLDRSPLRALKLRLPGFSLNPGSPKSSFINLTNFHLECIQILNGSDTFVLNFPVLKIFQVKYCRWVNLKLLKIYAPVLDTFISCTGSRIIGAPLTEDFGYSTKENNHSLCIQVISSSLSTYRSSGGELDNVVITDGSQVASASFSNKFEIHSLGEVASVGSQVRKILNETSRLNELELSNFMVQAIRSGHPLRKHDEMKRLNLTCPINGEQLFELLHLAPTLNFLAVNVDGRENCNYDNKVELLPSCIISHLEEVCFVWFSGKPRDYNFVKCFLKNGQVLKKITISGCHPEKHEFKTYRFPKFVLIQREKKRQKLEHIMVNQLSLIPRISTRLTIEFPGIRGKTIVVDKQDQLQQMRPSRQVRRPVGLA